MQARIRAERQWQALTSKTELPKDMLHLGKAIEIGAKYCSARELAKPTPITLNKNFSKRKHQSSAAVGV